MGERRAMCGRNRLKLAKRHKKQWLREEDTVEEGGGGLKVEKEPHKSTRGMFLLRLLSMERAHSIKSRHV